MAIDPSSAQIADEIPAKPAAASEKSEGDQQEAKGREDLPQSQSQTDGEASEGDEGNGAAAADLPAQAKADGETTDDGLGEEEDREGDEDEEPGECPFCLFMKGGPCRDNFIQWEDCVKSAEDAKEDIVEKCHQITFLLKECMEANSEYYEPVLQAEKAMGEAILEEEEEASSSPSLQAGAEEGESQIPAPLLQHGDADGSDESRRPDAQPVPREDDANRSSNGDESRSSAVEAQSSGIVEGSLQGDRNHSSESDAGSS